MSTVTTIQRPTTHKTHKLDPDCAPAHQGHRAHQAPVDGFDRGAAPRVALPRSPTCTPVITPACKPPYPPHEVEAMARRLGHGTPDACSVKSARGLVTHNGKPLSTRAMSIDVVGEHGRRTTAFYDPQRGFFKQDPGGPIVAMTAAERSAFVTNLAMHPPTVQNGGIMAPGFVTLRAEVVRGHGAAAAAR